MWLVVNRYIAKADVLADIFSGWPMCQKWVVYFDSMRKAWASELTFSLFISLQLKKGNIIWKYYNICFSIISNILFIHF